jgi:hypothetical protein
LCIPVVCEQVFRHSPLLLCNHVESTSTESTSAGNKKELRQSLPTVVHLSGVFARAMKLFYLFSWSLTSDVSSGGSVATPVATAIAYCTVTNTATILSHGPPSVPKDVSTWMFLIFSSARRGYVARLHASMKLPATAPPLAVTHALPLPGNLNESRRFWLLTTGRFRRRHWLC